MIANYLAENLAGDPKLPADDPRSKTQMSYAPSVLAYVWYVVGDTEAQTFAGDILGELIDDQVQPCALFLQRALAAAVVSAKVSENFAVGYDHYEIFVGPRVASAREKRITTSDGY